MNLKKLGNNETEVNNGNGYITLYSYNTPVATRHFASGKEWRTSKKWSTTTSKHINKWCGPNAVPVTQEQLEKIIAKGYTAL